MRTLMSLKKMIIAATLAISLCVAASIPTAEPETRTSYIVQGASFDAVLAAVGEFDVEVTHELGIIRAVAVNLTEPEADRLRNHPAVRRLYGNNAVAAAGKGGGKKSPPPEEEPSEEEMPGDGYSEFPSLVDADLLHDQGIDGWGVTIAIVDSGIYSGPGISQDRYGQDRLKAVYDATIDYEYVEGGRGKSKIDFAEIDIDESGHGSHVAGVATSGKLSNAGKYNGIAPAARIVAVKVFDAEGRGTYADVIRGVDWVVENRQSLQIEVLNMSLSAPPQSHYWDDPLNQAVMAAWNDGIVVVVSAGNSGPDAQSIGVPGNVPYVITVGAMTDSYTPAVGSDDRLATFSAAGPTYEGFVKPEIVAPGGHIMASMAGLSQDRDGLPELLPGREFLPDVRYLAGYGCRQRHRGTDTADGARNFSRRRQMQDHERRAPGPRRQR